MEFKDIPLLDVALFISDYFTHQGIDIVLSGGACVSIYSENSFISFDLDFVLLDYSQRKRIKGLFERIGFLPEGRHFRHPDTPFIVEFLAPPLSVGEEPVNQIKTIQKKGHSLRLLSPTDCVKDRLAAYFHWNDRPSLEQAVLVCLYQKVNFKELKRWGKSEEMMDKYVLFYQEYMRAKGEIG
ncbi:hypothetical protein ACFLT9_01325 [Acidobacteriota bacterium]